MDVRTLRLASIQLTAPLLEQFLAYQQVLVAELAKSTDQTDWNGRFAFAHSHALATSKLDALNYGRLKALIADWCASQTAIEQIRRRLELARAATAPTPADQALIARAQRELPALEARADFLERYGADAAALLASRGDEVLRLHREVARAEGCTRI